MHEHEGGDHEPPPRGSRAGKFLAYLAVAVLAAGAGAGTALALNHGSGPAAAPAYGSGPGSSPAGNEFGGGAGSGGGSAGSGPLNVKALRDQVDPAVVDVTAQLTYDHATAQGTGMVISPDGLVLTNNHVIDQATSVSSTLVESGRSYTARVLGYDAADDVALLKLQGASGLKPVTFGNSDAVKIGDSVLALGNAGGRGGRPSAARGVIQALDRTIEASNDGALTTETLRHMMQANTPIQEGDSGGPLVNARGQVIGMDTAANASPGSGGGAPTIGTMGFSIPINSATAIARTIAAGRPSATVHIGLAGFMGVQVGNAQAPCQVVSRKAPVKSGAQVCKVIPGTPAAVSGLSAGDVITSMNGHPVTSSGDLTAQSSGTHPGDTVTVTYTDSRGARHTTSFPLAEWAE